MEQKINLDGIKKAALSVKTLSMDAVQKAASGHPGLPMGCAELGALVYGEILNHYPADPGWKNRDRFVLSAGHGSMLLYSLLHLSGYDLSLDDIKQFRQLGSKTPGHPELGCTPGVETSTGPLGQGVSNAVGMAIAEKMLSSIFNTPGYNVVDHFTYVLASDGDMMEGVASEAASLAGHLGLGKLIVFYDSNKITIDGSTDLSFSEDVKKRFEGYHWQVEESSAYDIEKIALLVEKAKNDSAKPTLIIVTSVIAHGAATLEGKSKAHGAPLGDDEIKATKKLLGVPEDSLFYVDPEAITYFKSKKSGWQKKYDDWNRLFVEWGKKNPDLLSKWNMFFDKVSLPAIDFPQYKTGEKIATRIASSKAINAIAKAIPNFVGGSADLAASNNTRMTEFGDFLSGKWDGRNINFGIREHAMAGISNGIALHGGLRPFCATFLIFSDYMKPSIRLAALMKLPVIYVFTHDSIFVGEDGPTHQPIEQLTALRIIPGMTVLRPADAEETSLAYDIAISKKNGPVALALTRQNLEVFPKPDQWKDNARNGAYVADDCEKEPDIVIVASGSEVGVGLRAKALAKNAAVRVVSMLSLSLFRSQPDSFKQKIIPRSAGKIFIEAGVTHSWDNLGGPDDIYIGIDSFGESGPAQKVADHFNMNEKKVVESIELLMKKR
jgi:transketolase